MSVEDEGEIVLASARSEKAGAGEGEEAGEVGIEELGEA